MINKIKKQDQSQLFYQFFNPFTNTLEIATQKAVSNFTKKGSHPLTIIHGGRSMNKQLSIKRKTRDYDLKSRKPDHVQDIIEDLIDKRMGFDAVREVDKKLKKSDIKLRRIMSNIDNANLVDIVGMGDGVPFNIIDNHRYSTLRYERNKKLEILNNPVYVKRWPKAHNDLLRIDRELMKQKPVKQVPIKQVRSRSMFETVIDQFSKIDTDKDRVPDHRDCRPMDPTRHGIKPSRTMRQRLERLPIFVASELGSMGYGPAKHPRHIMQKEAKTLHPEATRAALSTIKKYPGIIGQMEKAPSSKYTFMMEPSKDFGITEIGGTVAFPHRAVVVYKPQELDTTKEEYISDGLKYIDEKYPEGLREFHKQRLLDQTKRLLFTDDSEHEKSSKIRHSMAIAAFHEIKHVEQSEQIEEFSKTIQFEKVIPYLMRRTEIEAIEASKKELKKRLEKGEISPEAYGSILGLE